VARVSRKVLGANDEYKKSYLLCFLTAKIAQVQRVAQTERDGKRERVSRVLSFIFVSAFVFED